MVAAGTVRAVGAAPGRQLRVRRSRPNGAGSCSPTASARCAVYAIGALLLDLDDPARVVGYSRTPLLSARPDEQDGYVPNVVYSCGGLVHDGLLWLPYGIGDCRIGVAWVALDEVLEVGGGRDGAAAGRHDGATHRPASSRIRAR